MNVQETIRTVLSDNNMNGGMELLTAFENWRAGRSNRELYSELGFEMDSPEYAAMTIFHVGIGKGINHDRNEAASLMKGLSNCSLFGLWLGNRLEKLGRSS